MKTELRGKKTRDYSIEYSINIESLINSYICNETSDEEIMLFEHEFGCSIATLSDSDDRVSIIRESILKMYNADISSSVLFLYNFIIWYKNSFREINKKEHVEEMPNKLLDFDDVLNEDTLINLRILVSKEYDKKNNVECIKHAQYKFLSVVRPRVIATDEESCLYQMKKVIDSVIRNSLYLQLITSSGDVDSCFLLQWEYYPVDMTFRKVVDTFNSELSRLAYKELSGNEFLYFNKIQNSEVDFSSIKVLPIVKDGKQRLVYVANKPIDQATLVYLSKRLNGEFQISYPNRDKIMEICFNLIDSLPRLDNYTIYKFDFKDFFDSVKIQSVYDKYIKHSNLYTYEKELILKLSKKYKYCVQGLPVSNALIEIISRYFDERVKTVFSEEGLIFYKRYVDDCILIFKHRITKESVSDRVEECCLDIFGKGVLLSTEKTAYQTKFDGDESFDYLGYSFTRCYWDKVSNKQEPYYYYEFGIASKKIEKYKKQLDAMFDAYEHDGKERVLLRRIQYYTSRIVFYNYDGSKYVNKSTWDVRGIVSSYRMLRRYVIYDNRNIATSNAGVKGKMPYRIQKDTYMFLRYYVKEKRDSLSVVPQYLKGKGSDDHTLWNGFLNNKSIVFQPNIGWSSALLSARLMEVGGIPFHKSYYEKTREYYTTLIKKL